MKKIFSIITIITALFLILSCGASLHNADVMHVEKVVLEGLTDLAGKEMVISGNWIPNKDGTDFWAHGLGDTSNILDGAIATVDGDGTVVFNIDVITSEAELEFLGKVNEDGWSDAKRFGGKAYAENPNAKVTNPFTGSDVPKIIYGKVGADDVIAWSIVDEIPVSGDATFVNITAIKFVNMPASLEGEKIGVVEGWFNGGDWNNYQPGMTGTVTGGEVTFTFPTAVKVESDSIGIQSTVVKDTNGIDWENKVLSETVSVAISFDDADHVIEVNFASITGSLK